LVAQLQPDSSIPSHIYELATYHDVGIPLKMQRKRLILIFHVLALIVGIAEMVWLGYTIYGYIAFTILSHTYPNPASVPDSQASNYFWLQAIHDNFWQNNLQEIAVWLRLLSFRSNFYSAYRTKLYLCIEGLLKIYKKKVEAVRWNEIKELYIPGGNLTRLVKQDGSDFILPRSLMVGRDKRITNVIIDEVTRCLLPGMLASYQDGQTIAFGTLEINQQGISRPGKMVYWRQVGDIALENGKLTIFYSQPGTDSEQSSIAFTGKWHTWQKSLWSSEKWPNLPVFVALVTTILDQRSADQVVQEPQSQQPRIVKETAALLKHRSRRRKRIAIAAATISIIGALSLAIGIPVYQSVQEQQRAARDTQLLINYYSKLAHQPFTAQVPGEHCGDGKKFWLDDDPKNVYTCQKNGLLMTTKDLGYVDAEWFTFVPDTLSTTDAFSSVSYFPHNYRVQVKATILSGEQSTCVSVGVHVQDFQGNQSFDICANGSWAYYRCYMPCNAYALFANGNLPYAHKTYLIRVDVTDNLLSLSVDNTKVTSVQDSTYTSTNQLELALYGSQNPTEPITALFSDFSYTPF